MGKGDVMEVKSRIGKLIDESPYKREYIRKHFNKSRNTISNWCTGKSYPIVPELFELAKLLGVWVDDLYEEVKEKKDPLDESIEELNLSKGALNVLKRNGIKTIRELESINFNDFRGLGNLKFNEITEKCRKYKGKNSNLPPTKIE